MFQNFHFVFVSAPPGGPKIVFANARAPEQVENAFCVPLDAAVDAYRGWCDAYRGWGNAVVNEVEGCAISDAVGGANSYAGRGASPYAGCGAIAGAVVSQLAVGAAGGAISGAVAMEPLCCSCYGIPCGCGGGGKFQNFYFVFVSASPGGPKIVFTNARAPEQVENAFCGPLDVAGFGANSYAVLAVEKEFKAPGVPAEPG
jgi:hypothetical protein